MKLHKLCLTSLILLESASCFAPSLRDRAQAAGYAAAAGQAQGVSMLPNGTTVDSTRAIEVVDSLPGSSVPPALAQQAAQETQRRAEAQRQEALRRAEAEAPRAGGGLCRVPKGRRGVEEGERHADQKGEDH